LDSPWQISWANCEKIDGGANIYSPGDSFFNIDAEPEALFERHLTIPTFLGVTAALWAALSLALDALTL
jgi:hypothetical protein